MSELLDVVAVETLEGYRLLITLASGERRRFDLTSFLGQPPFQRLRDPAEFALAFAAHGTVCWPGNIGIAQETLRDSSRPVYRLAELLEGAEAMQEMDWDRMSVARSGRPTEARSQRLDCGTAGRHRSPTPTRGPRGSRAA